MHEDLQLFLQNHIPKPKKVVLGVSEPKLGASINEALGITCTHVGAIPEIIRGGFLFVLAALIFGTCLSS